MKRFLSAKVRLTGILLWFGVLTCVFTVTAFLGAAGWLFEITSHFGIQYAACLLALAASFFLRRRFRFVAIFAGFAAIRTFVDNGAGCGGDWKRVPVEIVTDGTDGEHWPRTGACPLVRARQNSR